MRTSEVDRDSAAAPVSNAASFRDHASRTQFIAVIQGLEGVRFVALAETLDSLWSRLCPHVRAWSPYQLAPEACDSVMVALEEGRTEAAVKLYFAHAGRWEPEKLLLRAIAADGTADFGQRT